jgi:chromosome segregation ATPase
MIKNKVIKKNPGGKNADEKGLIRHEKKSGRIASKEIEKKRAREVEAIAIEEPEEIKEINERIRELNIKFFKLNKLWFKTQQKGLHLPVEHLKAAFKESEFTSFLGEIFGGVFCKTKAIEDKMAGINGELESIDEKINEVNQEIKELTERKKKIKEDLYEKKDRR